MLILQIALGVTLGYLIIKHTKELAGLLLLLLLITVFLIISNLAGAFLYFKFGHFVDVKAVLYESQLNYTFIGIALIGCIYSISYILFNSIWLISDSKFLNTLRKKLTNHK